VFTDSACLLYTLTLCRYPGDAIASKLVPLAYFVTGLGGITWAGYNVVMKEGGQ
jgi:hypothetical protein